MSDVMNRPPMESIGISPTQQDAAMRGFEADFAIDTMPGELEAALGAIILAAEIGIAHEAAIIEDAHREAYAMNVQFDTARAAEAEMNALHQAALDENMLVDAYKMNDTFDEDVAAAKAEAAEVVEATKPEVQAATDEKSDTAEQQESVFEVVPADVQASLEAAGVPLSTMDKVDKSATGVVTVRRPDGSVSHVRPGMGVAGVVNYRRTSEGDLVIGTAVTGNTKYRILDSGESHEGKKIAAIPVNVKNILGIEGTVVVD